MKNIFGVDLDKEEFDAKKFTLRETDEALLKRRDDMSEDLQEYAKRALLPKPLGILFSVSIVLAALCFFVAIDLREEPIWWLFVPAGVFAAIAIALGTCAFLRHRRVLKSDEFQAALTRTERVAEESRISLGVPADAADIDVFGTAYQIKKGKIKQGIAGCDFINYSMWMFVEQNNLCIADTAAVYAIPLSSILRVVRMERKITFDDWNKDSDYNKEPYKAYKISQNKDGTLGMRGCCSIQFLFEGEECEVVIPTYDIDAVLKMTGLSLCEAP